VNFVNQSSYLSVRIEMPNQQKKCF